MARRLSLLSRVIRRLLSDVPGGRGGGYLFLTFRPPVRNLAKILSCLLLNYCQLLQRRADVELLCCRRRRCKVNSEQRRRARLCDRVCICIEMLGGS